AAGYVKSIDNRWMTPGTRASVILAEEVFGHLGFGGGIGFADPRAGMGFGYSMNKMGGGLALNARGQSLIDAVYESLGYTSNVSGSWVPRSLRWAPLKAPPRGGGPPATARAPARAP